MSSDALALTPASVCHEEAGPSSGRSTKHVMILVPEGINLLKKSNRDTVWLKSLIGPFKRENLEFHTFITLMNDVIHSALMLYSYSLISFTSLFFKFLTLPPCLFAHQSNRYRADEDDSLD